MEQGKQAPGADEMRCPSCDAIVKKEAEICVNCGVGIRRRAASERKDKTASILLAVFLAFWTWLYTYKKDGWKFWLGLALTLTIFNPIWTWIIFCTPNMAIWVWAIVDAATKPREWYENY